MRSYLHALAMCQSMFCAIPCPWNVWDENARDKMLIFLPLVGLEIGLLWALLSWLSALLQLPVLIRGILLCAWPYVVTGYMHLDGYMDVTDAVKSWRDLARRREILKDSHVGSFAVIGCILLIGAQFAACAAMETPHLILALIPVISRCGSALAITVLKPMTTSQYVEQKPSKSRIVLLAVVLSAAVVIGFVCCGCYGFALLGCMVGYGLALRRGYRSLEGMNGDIAGYALCTGELCALLVCALI